MFTCIIVNNIEHLDYLFFKHYMCKFLRLNVYLDVFFILLRFVAIMLSMIYIDAISEFKMYFNALAHVTRRLIG